MFSYSGAKSEDKLSPDYVPSIFHYMTSPLKRQNEKRLEKYQRYSLRCSKKTNEEQALAAAETLIQLKERIKIATAAEALCSIGTSCADQQNVVHSVRERLDTSKSSQTELTSEFISQLISDNQNLRSQKCCLEQKLERFNFDESSFCDDKKVKILTGLPSSAVLTAIFKLIESHLPSRSLSRFQQFVITLLRIKHNLSIEFLSIIFGVSDSTISRIFLDCINQMYFHVVPPLVFWPDGLLIRRTMPTPFRTAYRNCVSIIDCFEVFCERPSDLKARAQTYSQYKSHNTVKYLISITPQGFISFISKGWGGRTSDKFITEHSGYLKYLSPGDTVLADRGFEISESVAMTHAKMEIPAFTKGKTQLDAMDVEKTRKIASVRIHVERAIGALRQRYTFLNSIVPIRMLQTAENESLTTLDKVVHVACALCNACPSLLPQ